VILDPYCSECYDGALRYTPIKETADVVIATHEHDDHGAVDSIAGKPLVFVHPASETVGKLRITGVDVAHDDAGGSKRGRNTIVVLDDGNIRMVHLGDLGHLLDKATVEAIGRVDVLIIPVGGYFTIDEKQAAAVVDSLHPKIVIPIHYKTDKVDFPIAPVDGFLKTQEEVQKPGTSSFEVTGDTLPEKRTTVVLAHSH
jgi:L-ascorbate metabolism protein UlaG (beta-lactamase superfamily)